MLSIKRKLTGFLTILILLLTLPNSFAFAADSPSFTITADKNTAQVGGEVIVTIHGDQLKALYGYEINLSYSTKSWKFVSVASSLNGGFTVPPIVKDGTVTFAFTKTGSSTEGINGSSNLATVKFKSIEAGSSNITLTRVKTVDKSLSAKEYAPNTSVTAHITSIAFKDVKEGFWAKSGIERAASLGILFGYPDGTFKPNHSVTRAEFVTMLVRALKDNVDLTSSELNFADSKKIEQWALPYVIAAVEEGWVTGFNDGTFRPDQPITRTEMTVIAARVLKLGSEESSSSIVFKDANSIPVWAKPSISAAYKAGIIQGQANNLFAPLSPTSRAETVTIILRIIDYGN